MSYKILMTLVILSLCNWGCVSGSSTNQGEAGVPVVTPGQSLALKYKDVPKPSAPKDMQGQAPAWDQPMNQRPVIVKQEDRLSKYGSLYDPDSNQLQGYRGKSAVRVGDIFRFKVQTNRESPPKTIAEAAEEANSDGGSNSDLLSSLPKLTPEDSDARLLKYLTFKLMQNMDDGTSLMFFERAYTNEIGGRNVQVYARVDSQKLVSAEDLTTDDLFDVRIRDQNGANVVNRDSTYWDDEYTLRLSGFNELGSKEARTLEAKRRELEGVKDRLKTRIGNFGTREKALAKEREELRKRQEKVNEAQAKLDDTLEESKEALEDEKSKVEQLEAQVKALQEEAAKAAAGGEG